MISGWVRDGSESEAGGCDSGELVLVATVLVVGGGKLHESWA